MKSMFLLITTTLLSLAEFDITTHNSAGEDDTTRPRHHVHWNQSLSVVFYLFV
jgi:hypothetical protein